LWTAYELENFKRYVNTTPKHMLGKAPPLGAYDSARGGARDHGFGRLTRSHFSRGGAFDSAGESAPSEDRAVRLLRHLAQKLSPEGWAQMQRVLCAEEEEAPVEDELPEYIDGLPLNALGEKIGAKDSALGSARIKAFDGKPIGGMTDRRALRRQLDELASRIVVGP
jgi:hypothetical protein